MTCLISKKNSLMLKLFLLGCSLPLLLTSPAWAQACSESQIKTNIEKFKDSASDISAFNALVNCGSKSVNTLTKALKDKNLRVRQLTAITLGNIGGEAQLGSKAIKEMALPLTEALKDENPIVRQFAAQALGNIRGKISKKAVSPLIEILKNKKEDANVRSNAAEALGYVGEKNETVVPILIEAIRDENVYVRIGATNALGNLGKKAKGAVFPLIEALKDKSANVRGNAAYALGSFGEKAQEIVPLLIKIIQDKDESVDVRANTANALVRIGSQLQDDKHKLSSAQLEKFITEFETALKILEQDRDNILGEKVSQINVSLNALKEEKQSRWSERIIQRGSFTWLAHALIWAGLIFFYPKSPQIQAIFFWNPKIRKFFGLGYVGLALTWIPFLRSKLFAPFKESLLSDADLDNFDPQAYFANSEVKRKGSTDAKPVREAIPEIRSQIVLEGESGVGKSLFLRQLVHSSRRIVVYLPAKKCAQGVMEAIQAKLHGPAKDPDFLQHLIYSGAIDICIDGLNEVTPDTRANITSFVESYFKGNIIMATQPLEWIPPSTADTYILQPLKRNQLEQFLVSRQTVLPQDAPVSGSDYEQACKNYLAVALNIEQSNDELISVRRLLSNPMELTVVSQMLANKKKPDLLNLQQQKYEIMAADYERVHLARFPLTVFAEAVYQMRLNDEDNVPAEQWRDELECMERYKMVLSRQLVDDEGKVTKEWHFRHDKIQEFFIVQTFLGEGKENRLIEHISDPRFRGVYFLLATMMPLGAAMELRETLVRHAAKTKDHTISDTFIQLLLPRQTPSRQALCAGRAR